MRKVIGLDLYNQNITGGVAKTLTCMRVDVSNIPCVIVGGGVTHWTRRWVRHISITNRQTHLHQEITNNHRR